MQLQDIIPDKGRLLLDNQIPEIYKTGHSLLRYMLLHYRTQHKK